MKFTFLDAPAQWSPFVIVGSVCVIAGGLVAAVTATSPSEHGAWVSACLVLVGCVAQIGLGLGQAVLTTAGLSRQRLVTELGALNFGNVAVLAGELLAMGSRGGVPAVDGDRAGQYPCGADVCPDRGVTMRRPRGGCTATTTGILRLAQDKLSRTVPTDRARSLAVRNLEDDVHAHVGVRHAGFHVRDEAEPGVAARLEVHAQPHRVARRQVARARNQ